MKTCLKCPGSDSSGMNLSNQERNTPPAVSSSPGNSIFLFSNLNFFEWFAILKIFGTVCSSKKNSWNTYEFLGWLSIRNEKVRVSEKRGTNFKNIYNLR